MGMFFSLPYRKTTNSTMGQILLTNTGLSLEYINTQLQHNGKIETPVWTLLSLCEKSASRTSFRILSFLYLCKRKNIREVAYFHSIYSDRKTNKNTQDLNVIHVQGVYKRHR